jgi:predicted CoA-binding protein
MASKRAIDSFLSCRRIAVVGVSRDPKDFSRAVFRAFAERGYDVVPVSAAGGEGDGGSSARRLGDVMPPGWVHGAHRSFRRVGGSLPS